MLQDDILVLNYKIDSGLGIPSLTVLHSEGENNIKLKVFHGKDAKQLYDKLTNNTDRLLNPLELSTEILKGV